MQKLTNPQLQRLDVEAYKKSEKTPIIVILDDIRSLNNIGSVFRTCDAFRIEKIYLCGITACPPHKDIHKTALGATESVDWQYHPSAKDIVLSLQKDDIQVIAVEQVHQSTMLNNFTPQPNQKYALVFGNEVNGVSQEVVSACNLAVEIPQIGTKHSLNISVSAGIVIWDIFSKMLQLQ